MDVGDIGSLSHRQLQEECRKFDLSASGSTIALRRRLRGKILSQNNNNNSNNNKEEEDEEAPANKRQKSVTDDLICPITHELPYDAVTAEDGCVYERSAIEQHFRMHQGSALKSPITNEPMGQRLIPSPRIRSLIEALIETRAIEGDLRDAWIKKEEEKKRMKELLEKASSGDTAAMHLVCRKYRNGSDGFPKDSALAYEWVQKAHDAGSVEGTASLGQYLLEGKIGDHVIPKKTMQGIIFTTMAAERGSNLAAYNLGLLFANGMFGVEVDNVQAVHWLQKSLREDCPYKHLHPADLKIVEAKLQEMLNCINE